MALWTRHSGLDPALLKFTRVAADYPSPDAAPGRGHVSLLALGPGSRARRVDGYTQIGDSEALGEASERRRAQMKSAFTKGRHLLVPMSLIIVYCELNLKINKLLSSLHCLK